RWNTNGVTEIVVKNGEHGCTLLNNGITSFIPLNKVCKPVDTTAAGDSFNGAYLAAKLKGKSMADCVKLGQMCASVVVMHKGAIIEHHISLEESA
ncbi:MAG: PfkB family carbohydrate kinase, partial [Thalassotalea sp.]|nr:PfkB family carbohydrate kinase [Thalassotalea sp.]